MFGNLAIMDTETTNSLMKSYLQEKGVLNGSYQNNYDFKTYINEFYKRYDKKFVINRKYCIDAISQNISQQYSGNTISWYTFNNVIHSLTELIDEQPQKQNDDINNKLEIMNREIQKIKIEKQNDIINKEIKIKETINNVSNNLSQVFNWFKSSDSFTKKYVIISLLLFTILMLMFISNGAFTLFISLILIICVLNIMTQFKSLSGEELNSVVEDLKDKIDEINDKLNDN